MVRPGTLLDGPGMQPQPVPNPTASPSEFAFVSSVFGGYFVVTASCPFQWLCAFVGGGRLSFSQSVVDSTLPVTRTDVAEVIVSSLLDPRACNVACSVTASEYTQMAAEQDISKLLEVMQPNRM
jgi:hypothetical protein